jgi:hypothetical protein
MTTVRELEKKRKKVYRENLRMFKNMKCSRPDAHWMVFSFWRRNYICKWCRKSFDKLLWEDFLKLVIK